MKVALVHDYLNQYGGAERVLEALCELYLAAPIYTLLYDERRTHGVFKGRDIRASVLQKVPFASRWHRGVVWAMPAVVEQFDMNGFDLVISDSASFAKGIITRPETLHICYCHTPLRYAWTDHARWSRDFTAPALQVGIPFFQNYLRLWDFAAAQRVDYFIANSATVARRIKRYYRRDATVIHPPVDVTRYALRATRKQEHYLVVSRLLPYKSVDLAVRAFNELQLPLVVVGDGPERRTLEALAKPNIQFAGAKRPTELAEYYAGARALIFPQEEDFGLAAVEALASGTPVIGFGRGGLKEIVEHGTHGLLFNEQTPQALAQAVRAFEGLTFNPAALQQQAERFSTPRFKDAITKFVEEKIKQHQNNL